MPRSHWLLLSWVACASRIFPCHLVTFSRARAGEREVAVRQSVKWPLADSGNVRQMVLCAEISKPSSAAGSLLPKDEIRSYTAMKSQGLGEISQLLSIALVADRSR